MVAMPGDDVVSAAKLAGHEGISGAGADYDDGGRGDDGQYDFSPG